MADRQPFLEAVRDRVVLGDGGMGSEIYARGVFINKCWDELNLSNPKLISGIHRDFVRVGSEVIETNTYGANAPKLSEHGLESSLAEIIAAGVTLAREQAGAAAYVAGSIGPLGSAAKQLGMSDDDQRAAYADVATFLADAGSDILYLDTFTSVHDLRRAVQACRAAAGDIPIAASFSFHRGFVMGSEDFLVQPEDVAWVAEQSGADIVGANCGDGPLPTLEIVEHLGKHTKLPVSAFPNVGGPALIDGRQVYLSSAEYLAEYGRRYVQKGARLIGGCCGVTPKQINEVRSFLTSIQPRAVKVAVRQPEEEEAECCEPTPIAERSPWGAKLGTEFMVSVELDPPHGLESPTKSLAAAAFLKDNGIDAVNIADGPRAMARMSPTAMAVLVKQHCGMETIIHYCCRDRNVLAMQMDLIGANNLGLKNLMLITGDPPKMGNFPDATAVFDVDSIGLISFANKLNHGQDLSGKYMSGEHTDFVIGTGCNPGAVDLELEARRFEEKVEAGADYVFSQPVYDIKHLHRFLDATAHVKPIPFFVGILPLASLKNAEFLTREVPGMEVPEAILDQLRDARTKEAQREIGISVAAQNLEAAADHSRVRGTYVFPPFGNYEAILRVLRDAGVRK